MLARRAKRAVGIGRGGVAPDAVPGISGCALAAGREGAPYALGPTM